MGAKLIVSFRPKATMEKSARWREAGSFDPIRALRSLSFPQACHKLVEAWSG
ncbi:MULTISPECIES: hypothetical protein [Mesorhizobium]|uniref:hypothetical protein n=1 Tax=Mesorhizobium TaxID=68287 RepID=UPI0013E0E3E1|nr:MULTISPECIES: hypothetical protein [Mesorhizobium]MCF6124136.1 hypothetical protein [Mesorhizobium ciceri]MCQ8815135.1 hypothetical protein [Mesorhizobium sp. SEMIA396]MCQ8870727.1 hypothetical protein [Mesorhizobium sp. LMG17149]